MKIRPFSYQMYMKALNRLLQLQGTLWWLMQGKYHFIIFATESLKQTSKIEAAGKKVNACTFLADLAKLLSTQLCTASSNVCLSSSQGQTFSRNDPETPRWLWEFTHKTHNWSECLFRCLTLLPRTMLPKQS